MKLFKVKTNYLKRDDKEENGVKASEVRLFEAIDYSDAQNQAIEYINKNGCMGECEMEIGKVSYEDVIRKSQESSEELTDFNETFWYEVKIEESIVNDKDEEKFIQRKYIVEGEDLEDALDVTKKYIDGEFNEDWYFIGVNETSIEEVILLNLNV